MYAQHSLQYIEVYLVSLSKWRVKALDFYLQTRQPACDIDVMLLRQKEFVNVLSRSITRLKSKLDRKTLQVYHIYMKLTLLDSDAFLLFVTKVKITGRCKCQRKKSLLVNPSPILGCIPDIFLQSENNPEM